MLRRQITCLLGVALGAVATAVLADRPLVGNSNVFLTKYAAFTSQQLNSRYPTTVIIQLGYTKGLSSSFAGTAGAFSLDLRSGAYSADLTGLKRAATYSLWFVNQQEDSPVSELTDARFIKLADITADAPAARVVGTLDAAKLGGFAIDRVVLSPGADAITEVIASGAMSVMEKIFFGGLDLMGSASLAASLPFASLVPKVLSSSVRADMAAATALGGDGVSAMATPLDVLISQGERLFFDERFNGNGRTCGTCHPASNNFTIDPAFIATLPNTDPLFVAEFNPALAQLERPVLMRQFGLILENVDGLQNPTVKFVMRSVPHTLGMQQSLQKDTSAAANGPAQMTGWSGDGAPGAGSLRDFAVGAVTQHFTKTLARQVGPDFNLPNNQQLDGMEAFQLSLGRATDFNLSGIVFQDANVDTGRSLFLNGTGNPNAGGTCSACHGNGGARATIPGANLGQNRNFNTNVEDRIHPARAVQNFPIDGGFGQTPANADGSFGNRTFNTPPVVEAADTAPFFHNNVVTTLEGVVQFYSGPEFNNPRAPAARFSFNATQVTNLANFMRALNTLQNIDVARGELQEVLALTGNPQPEVQSRLQRAFFDTGDAIRVLNQTGIFPNAVTQLTTARNQVTQAQATSNPNTRSVIIQQAITTLGNARTLIATP